jgi:hypothetical protein
MDRNPELMQRIYDACKEREPDDSTLTATHVIGEDENGGIRVRALYRDDTKPHMIGIKEFTVAND